MVALLAAFAATYLVFGGRAHGGRGFVSHRLFFAFGLLYYQLLPLAALWILRDTGDQTLQIWVRLGSSALAYRREEYSVDILMWVIAFGTASALTSRVKVELPYTPSPSRALIALFPILAIFMAMQMLANRHLVLQSYASIFEGESAQRGPLLSACLTAAIGTAWWFADRRHGSAKSRWQSAWLALWALSAVFVLAIGSRLYVITSGVILLAVQFGARRVPTRVFLLGVPSVALLFAGIGAIRYGLAGASSESVLIGLVSEPIYTCFSLFDYLRLPDSPQWFHLPSFDVLAAFTLNILPTALWPGKLTILAEASDRVGGAISPFGALNAYVSFTAFFGRAGSWILCGILGAIGGLLERQRVPLGRVMYGAFCALLPFSLFRDPLYASIFKYLIQFVFILPLSIVAIDCLINHANELVRRRFPDRVTGSNDSDLAVPR